MIGSRKHHDPPKRRIFVIVHREVCAEDWFDAVLEARADVLHRAVQAIAIRECLAR